MLFKDWWENLFYPFRLFTVLAISFLVGLTFANFLTLNYLADFRLFIFLFCALILTAFINFLLKLRGLVLISFAFLFFSLGLFYLSYFSYKSTPSLIFDQSASFNVVVAERPAVTATNQKLTVLADINGPSAAEAGKKTRLLLKAPVFPIYRYGDKLEINGKIVKPEKIEDFDYPGYLKGKGIYGILESEQITIVGQDSSIWVTVKGALFLAIEKSASLISRSLPEPHASLASGILLGSQSNMSQGLKDDLQKTGLTHIVALSGFNVTIITIALAWVLAGFLGKKRSFWAGLIFVIIFILATGCSASVVRAGIFSMLILFGTTYGRRADQLNILTLTALVMLLQNPYLLFYDLGFQLSFAAFIGIIYLAPLLSDLYQKISKRSETPDFAKMTCETLAAQLAVIPIIFYNFRTISLISPIANLLVVWSVAWIMLFTFVAIILGFIWAPFAQAIALLLWPMLEYVILAIHYLARVPLASLTF
ncbi:MAG: ComEC/Rec2 family competence protein [Patescibacteria group bacterium]|jgi:competence protein ComEC